MTSSHQSWILRCRCLKKMKNLVEKVARARGCNHSCPCVWRLSGCVFLKIEAKQKKTWRPGNENMNFEPSKSSRSYHVRHIFLQETAVFFGWWIMRICTGPPQNREKISGMWRKPKEKEHGLKLELSSLTEEWTTRFTLINLSLSRISWQGAFEEVTVV